MFPKCRGVRTLQWAALFLLNPVLCFRRLIMSTQNANESTNLLWGLRPLYISIPDSLNLFISNYPKSRKRSLRLAHWFQGEILASTWHLVKTLQPKQIFTVEKSFTPTKLLILSPAKNILKYSTKIVKWFWRRRKSTFFESV